MQITIVLTERRELGDDDHREHDDYKLEIVQQKKLVRITRNKDHVFVGRVSSLAEIVDAGLRATRAAKISAEVEAEAEDHGGE